jgi:hypothetical protein
MGVGLRAGISSGGGEARARARGGARRQLRRGLLLLGLGSLLFVLAGCPTHQPGCYQEVAKRKWQRLPSSSSELRIFAEERFHDDASARDVADSAAAACKAQSQDRSDAEAAFFAARACNWLTYREQLPKWLDGDCASFGEVATQYGPDVARYHYELAIAIGLEVRSASVKSALLNIAWLVSVLEKVIELDEGIDGGGPLRTLGLLYLRAPPWPTSVGDEEAALELLERALQSDDSHPLNHLFYSEALLVDERVEEARVALARFRELNVPERYYWRSAYWTRDAEELEKRIREAEDDL